MNGSTMFMGTNPLLSNLALGGKGMNPLVLMALINAGASLGGATIEGLGAGAEKAKDRKYREGQIEQLKPDMPYYRTPYMPGYDRVLAEAILGNLQMRMGGKLGQFGLDINAIREQMGLNRPYSQGQPQKSTSAKNVLGGNVLQRKYTF